MKKRITVIFAITVALTCFCTACGAKNSEISESRAKEIALSNANLSTDQVTFAKVQIEHEDGKKIYDIEFYTKDFTEYDYEIDAETGKILSFDSDAEGFAPESKTEYSDSLTEDEAKSIAINKVTGASESDITEFRLDRDDGKEKYEGKIQYDGIEYEFEIDAENGNILTWETESVF